MLIAVLAGQPVIDTSNFALVAVNVTVAVPAHVASASVIGGFSFEALSSALNVFAGVGVGVGVGATVGASVGASVGEGLGAAAVPPHAAITTAAAAMPANRRILRSSLAASSVYTARRAVRMRSVGRAGHLSRILARTVIPLERRSPSASSGLPGDGAGHAIVPLRGLAPGSACPFHPARAGSSLWRGPRLTAEGCYPLPCPVESGLSSAAFADATIRPARHEYSIALHRRLRHGFGRRIARWIVSAARIRSFVSAIPSSSPYIAKRLAPTSRSAKTLASAASCATSSRPHPIWARRHSMITTPRPASRAFAHTSSP